MDIKPFTKEQLEYIDIRIEEYLEQERQKTKKLSSLLREALPLEPVGR